MNGGLGGWFSSSTLSIRNVIIDVFFSTKILLTRGLFAVPKQINRLNRRTEVALPHNRATSSLVLIGKYDGCGGAVGFCNDPEQKLCLAKWVAREAPSGGLRWGALDATNAGIYFCCWYAVWLDSNSQNEVRCKQNLYFGIRLQLTDNFPGGSLLKFPYDL